MRAIAPGLDGCARRPRPPGGAELPLVISDHADWDELTATIREVGASEIGHHGREEALVHCARPRHQGQALAILGYDDEEWGMKR
jgi:putative mRNA 3-end processing factor